MKRALRILGTVAFGAGVLAAAWAITVWQWEDPFTTLYTSQQQNRLEDAYENVAGAYVAPEVVAGDRAATIARERRLVAREARRYRSGLETGDAVGRLRVPRLGLDAIVVNGTDSSTLKKGPGRYAGSFVPGEGELVYVAGHRTTYSAPFARIDRLEHGDLVTFEVPYATFTYRVRDHVIVPADDVDRLRSRGREVLALQACHPRFFATQRWIVYAEPIRVSPRKGIPYTVPGSV